MAWALFNTALREHSRKTGHLVHKNSGSNALTLQELRDLVNAREDLVRQVATFGADIPTTPMYWKREGNHLEWIVRHMSWTPPWCESAVDDTKYRAATRQRAKREILKEEHSSARAEDDTAVKVEDVKEEPTEDACPLLDVHSEASTAGDIDDLEGPRGADRDEDGPSSAAQDVSAQISSTDHTSLWHHMPALCSRDDFGYGRTPAFWFTLNLAYNHLHEIHRFAEATEQRNL